MSRRPAAAPHRERPFPFRVPVIFFVTLVWFGAFAMIGVDPHHDGIMLKCAADVASGKRLFAESFCQYGDLVILLQAAALKVAGVHLLTIRWFTVLFYAGIAVLLDRLWRRFLRTAAARGLHLVLFWGMVPFTMVPFHPWSSVYALFFMLLAVEFLLSAIERGEGGRIRRGLLFASGIAAGCAFGCRTPVGLVTVAAAALSGVLIAGSGKRRDENGEAGGGRAAAACSSFGGGALWWSLGAAAWPLAGAARIVLSGAWQDYLHQCFRFTGRFAVERSGLAATIAGGGGPAAMWGRISECLFPFVNSLWPIDIFYGVLPLAVLTAGGWSLLLWLRGGRRISETRLPILILFGLASWHQFYPVPCVRHLYWASVPMFGAFVWLLQEMWSAFPEQPARRRMLRVAAAVLLIFPSAAVAWRLNFGLSNLSGMAKRRCAENIPVLRGMRLNREEANLCRFISTVVRELPPQVAEHGFLNATADGLFSLMMPEPKPAFRHPMFVNWGRGVYPDYPEKLSEFIAAARPVVLSEGVEPPFPGSMCIGEAGLRGCVYRFWIIPPAR